MKLGVISDTHDNTKNILLALEILRKEGVETILHCGDLTNPDNIWFFEGFKLIYVFGNLDFSTSTITANVQTLSFDNIAVPLFKDNLEGKMIGAVHGHISGYIYDLARKGNYNYVFHGHTHQRRQEKVGSTCIINPGALGGKNSQYASICTVDLITDQVQFFYLSQEEFPTKL